MEKKELEEWINQLNNVIGRHEGEKYLTKYHLIDELDAVISKFINENDLKRHLKKIHGEIEYPEGFNQYFIRTVYANTERPKGKIQTSEVKNV